MGQGDVAESIDIIMQSKEFFGKAVYRYIAVIYITHPNTPALVQLNR
jgi:hypothetical protein